jgi:hypothetical protein
MRPGKKLRCCAGTFSHAGSNNYNDAGDFATNAGVAPFSLLSHRLSQDAQSKQLASEINISFHLWHARCSLVK